MDEVKHSCCWNNRSSFAQTQIVDEGGTWWQLPMDVKQVNKWTMKYTKLLWHRQLQHRLFLNAFLKSSMLNRILLKFHCNRRLVQSMAVRAAFVLLTGFFSYRSVEFMEVMRISVFYALFEIPNKWTIYEDEHEWCWIRRLLNRNIRQGKNGKTKSMIPTLNGCVLCVHAKNAYSSFKSCLW